MVGVSVSLPIVLCLFLKLETYMQEGIILLHLEFIRKGYYSLSLHYMDLFNRLIDHSLFSQSSTRLDL
jgi:hypothetical protein